MKYGSPLAFGIMATTGLRARRASGRRRGRCAMRRRAPPSSLRSERTSIQLLAATMSAPARIDRAEDGNL